MGAAVAKRPIWWHETRKRYCIGDKVRQFREAADQSRQQLASAAGVSLGGYIKIETNETVPDWPTVVALAETLGVSVAEFAPAPAASKAAPAAVLPAAPKRRKSK